MTIAILCPTEYIKEKPSRPNSLVDFGFTGKSGEIFVRFCEESGSQTIAVLDIKDWKEITHELDKIIKLFEEGKEIKDRFGEIVVPGDIE